MRQRLLARGHPLEEVEGVLHSLSAAGLQCDVRWARALVRRRRAQGYSSARIRAELRATSGGAAEHLFSALNDANEEGMETGPDDDLARAVRLLERRFPDTTTLAEPRGRARAVRFLVSRGYSGGLAMKALARRTADESGADSSGLPVADDLADE